MDKETGEPVLVDGEEVTAEVTFVAEDSAGTVEVVFMFDSTGHDRLPIWLPIAAAVLVVAAIVATVKTIKRWKPDIDE